MITFSFEDGKTGDGDLTVNGTIVDPSAPTASEWTGGGSGGGCSCGGPAFAGHGPGSGKTDFDIGIFLFALLGMMSVLFRRHRRRHE